MKRIFAHFYQSESGSEPVREWLKELSSEERKVIGIDLKKAEYAWPIGMPIVRKLSHDMWEVRSRLPNSIARIIFTINDNKMILLHGFKKKSQKTPHTDLNTAMRRLQILKGNNHEQTYR